jgi:putative acetyltransferase
MLSIERASYPKDAQIIADLFLEYLDYLFERAPEDRDAILQKYDPAKVDLLVADFFRVNARPSGDLVIARRDGTPIGCGMMREMSPGIAEIQRVFIRPAARGTGAGKSVMQALMDQARQDGQRIVRLDTSRKLVEAAAFYKALGFHERPSYHDATPYLDHLLVFFERAL